MKDIKIYTTEEISELLNVTIRTLYTYIKEGRLQANKIGGKWIVTEDNLKAFIEGKSKPKQ